MSDLFDPTHHEAEIYIESFHTILFLRYTIWNKCTEYDEGREEVMSPRDDAITFCRGHSFSCARWGGGALCGVNVTVGQTSCHLVSW